MHGFGTRGVDRRAFLEIAVGARYRGSGAGVKIT
jgi:hypothetical protein